MTAWFANFLTYGGHFCHHEALTKVGSFEELPAFLGGNGNSDCGIPLFSDDFLRLFDDCPTLIIERDAGEVIASLDRLGFDFPMIDACLDGIEAIKRSGNVLTMGCENISPKSAWDFLIGDWYDSERGDMLLGMRVTTKMNYTEDQVKNMNSLVGA